MPELTVVAVITAQHGKADVVRAAFEPLVAASRAEEGCLQYDLFESDIADTFVTVERWRAPEDLQVHMATPHIAQFGAAAGSAFAGPPVIHSLRPVGA